MLKIQNASLKFANALLIQDYETCNFFILDETNQVAGKIFMT